MDTPIKTEPLILDFQSFIRKYFDWYEIDGFNTKTIHKLGLYANRDKKFNGMESSWHIDRSILLYGNPGTGKDELFRLLNQYYKYLRSPYVFSHKVVWKFAEPFATKDIGYKCFSEEGLGNRYYEELALTDENTGLPTREMVQNFGNKILIGAELVHLCYNSWKHEGWMAHFSTNIRKEDDLRDIYGERIFSRLKEMCNFMPLIGKDRRSEVEPVFIKNRNQAPGPPPPPELSRDEVMENKKVLELAYNFFLVNDDLPEGAALLYDCMVAYGVKICEDEKMRGIMEEVAPRYLGEGLTSRATASDKEKNKSRYVWEKSREIALLGYYELLKEKGCTSIFEERVVNLENFKMAEG